MWVPLDPLHYGEWVIRVNIFTLTILRSFGVGGSYIGYADKLSKTIVRSLLQLSDAQSVAMGPLTPLSDHKLRGAAYSNLKKIVESTPREELTSTVDDMIRGASPSASAADSAVVHSVATKLAANIDAWTGM